MLIFVSEFDGDSTADFVLIIPYKTGRKVGTTILKLKITEAKERPILLGTIGWTIGLKILYEKLTRLTTMFLEQRAVETLRTVLMLLTREEMAIVHSSPLTHKAVV